MPMYFNERSLLTGPKPTHATLSLNPFVDFTVFNERYLEASAFPQARAHAPAKARAAGSRTDARDFLGTSGK